MITNITNLTMPDGGHLGRLAAWTDRIKAGELPAAVPPWPHDAERNIVVIVYDWSDLKSYLHDLIVTDRRKPMVNSYGAICGAAELSTDNLPVLDPVKITKTTMQVPIRDQDAPSSALANSVVAPSPYFGAEHPCASMTSGPIFQPMVLADLVTGGKTCGCSTATCCSCSCIAEEGDGAWHMLCSLCQRLLHRFGIAVNDFKQCAGSLVGDKTPLLPIAHHRQR